MSRSVVPLPPREYLLYRFEYNPETGDLMRRGGKRSAYALHSAGYYTVSCEGKQFLAHRGARAGEPRARLATAEGLVLRARRRWHRGASLTYRNPICSK